MHTSCMLHVGPHAQESDLGPWYHGGISKSIAESRVGTAMLDYQELKAEREKLERERKAIHTELMQMRMSQGDATVLEVAQKEELLGDAEELVRECDRRLSEKLLGDTVEAFHLVYKPSGNPKDQVYSVCICRDPDAQTFKHYNVFHWVQSKHPFSLSLSLLHRHRLHHRVRQVPLVTIAPPHAAACPLPRLFIPFLN